MRTTLQRPIRQRPIRWLTAGMLVVAACGSSDDDTAATPTTGEDATPTASTSAPDAASATTTGTTGTTGTTASEATATPTTAADAAVETTVETGGDTAGDGESGPGSGPAAAPGSPVVPASSVDLDAVPPETAIVVVGDDALVYSVIGPGVRKCLAVLDEVLIEGRFVDESGAVMQTDGFDAGEFVLREGDDGELGLLVGDGINERAWGAGSTDIYGLDVSGGEIGEFDTTDGTVRGSASMVDLLGGDGANVAVEFGVNCR